MTKLLPLLLQTALVSGAVLDNAIFHHVRQAPVQEPAELDLSKLGLLGKIIPKGFKPPPGLPLPQFMIAPPTPVAVFSKIDKPATIRPGEAKRFRVSWGPFDLLEKNVKLGSWQIAWKIC